MSCVWVIFCLTLQHIPRILSQNQYWGIRSKYLFCPVLTVVNVFKDISKFKIKAISPSPTVTSKSTSTLPHNAWQFGVCVAEVLIMRRSWWHTVSSSQESILSYSSLWLLCADWQWKWRAWKRSPMTNFEWQMEYRWNHQGQPGMLSTPKLWKEKRAGESQSDFTAAFLLCQSGCSLTP